MKTNWWNITSWWGIQPVRPSKENNYSERVDVAWPGNDPKSRWKRSRLRFIMLVYTTYSIALIVRYWLGTTFILTLVGLGWWLRGLTL